MERFAAKGEAEELWKSLVVKGFDPKDILQISNELVDLSTFMMENSN